MVSIEESSVILILTLVAQTYAENPRQSAIRTPLQLDIPSRSLRRIIQDLGLKVYRPHLLQELRTPDYAKRVEFCEWYLIMNEANPNFAKRIL